MPARYARLVFAFSLGACGDDPTSTCSSDYETDDLATMDAWQPVALVSDPFADHQPEDPQCPEGDAVAESGWFEIDTGACNYVTVSQPALFDVEPGSELEVALAHFALTASEPFEAHVAVRIGDETVWELFRQVDPPDEDGNPSVPYEALTEGVELPSAVPAGTPVLFHLHNHGYNTWNLFSIRAPRCLD